MIDGRHCTEKDLNLLLKETKKVKSSLSNEQINLFLDLVFRFDAEIAEKIRREIKLANDDKETILKVINENIKTLTRSVIVDINEHK